MTGPLSIELTISTQTGPLTAEIAGGEAVVRVCSRGRGVGAASRCMNSSGYITRCVVSSRNGVLRFSTIWSAALVCTRSPTRAGRVM